ncbi:hypothetical protein PG637_00785 [Riemerella anatipestifer]|nr:hypothetical protein [Riemerella anatipestifer]MDY3324207.1 hypothetical protein [Riemerella anatipestifer]MDY3353022.1 hypothetical protein [Riemerella anatipestifer]
MNIIENIVYSNDKPSVVIIKKSDTLKQFAVGLGKDVVLKKHITPVPATLVVLKGNINFEIEGKTHLFKAWDTYEIPVNIPHEVVGISDENLFIVTQEL